MISSQKYHNQGVKTRDSLIKLDILYVKFKIFYIFTKKTQHKPVLVKQSNAKKQNKNKQKFNPDNIACLINTVNYELSKSEFRFSNITA
jgi:hypothetical protein